MRRMLALELREAFSNRWFTIAVLAAVLLAALAAGESVEKFNTNGFDASDSSYYAYYSSWSSVSVWLGVGAWGLSSLYYLFFYGIIFVAPLAYSWSSSTDIRSGYARQLAIRSTKKYYLFSKLIACFSASFAVAACGLLANLLFVSLFFPAYSPFSYDSLYTGMTYGKVLADLYYANPILFIAVRTLFDSCVCGAWAAFVASIGWFSRHVALNFIASYLGLLGLEFLNHYFFAAITTAPIFEFSIFQIIQSWSFEYAHEPLVSFAVLVILALGSVLLTLVKCGRDLL